MQTITSKTSNLIVLGAKHFEKKRPSEYNYRNKKKDNY
jgi:hypothetical protein